MAPKTSNSAVILENLIATAHGIAHEFGKNCEVCVHDLKSKNLSHTVIYIMNGQISQRSIGGGPSKVVLKALESLERGENINDRFSYITRTKDGRILKSSTIFQKDYDNTYRYILAINYDITNFVNIESGLKDLISTEEDNSDYGESGAIPTNVGDLLDLLIKQSIQLIGKQPALMTKDEKVKAIQYLNDAGAFLITKSGDKVSSYFGISKFTLYSYIDVNKKGGKKNGSKHQMGDQ